MNILSNPLKGTQEVDVLLTNKSSMDNQSFNQKHGLYFLDGKRKIDFVLVYQHINSNFKSSQDKEKIVDNPEYKRELKRMVFETNLKAEGLEIEKTLPQEDGRGYVFVKLHAPFKILCKYAQIMNIKMPIKEDRFLLQTDRWWKRFKDVIALPQKYKPRERHYFTCVFNRDYLDRFLIRDEQTFFDNAKRSKIVDEILTRCKYDDQLANKFGLGKLIATGAYLTAYPLHDGPYDAHLPACEIESIIGHVTIPPISCERLSSTTPETKFNSPSNDYYDDNELVNSYYQSPDYEKTKVCYEPGVKPHASALKREKDDFWANRNDRQLLYEIWSNPNMFYKEQPISLVRKYFGEKIAIYFAWLGFYTAMLVPAALLGILCFLYGLATMNRYVPTSEICDPMGAGNITMCPLCDQLCGFWKLKDSCKYSRLTYLFDNPSTIVFSIFMSFWATLFLEFWKRKQNELAWDWDTKDFEEEEIVRPEYETQVKTMRKNPVTNTMEPYLPLYSKALRLMGATITVITFLIMVIGVVLGIIVYRLSVVSVIHSQGDKILSQNAKMTTNISAAVLNLIAIILLNRIYSQIAAYLTNLECPRTRSDYEDSFTVKMFLFQFVNFYSSLIYIAFFKGRYSGNPSGGGKLFGYQMEPCEPSGCMTELFIQFIVIMIGKQILNNCQELLLPVILKWWRKRSTVRAHLKVLRKSVLSSRHKTFHLLNPTGLIKNDARISSLRPNTGSDVNFKPLAQDSQSPISDNKATTTDLKIDSAKSFQNDCRTAESNDKGLPQYEEDFALGDSGPLGLFDEYLEMAIQFGFTTLFVTAFPLAPLFSLLNNVIEIRLDAFKYVTQFRRSVSNRAQDIGVWYDIINVIAKLAVITNAMIIAFTSDYIPKMVYKYHFSRYTTNAVESNFNLPPGPTPRDMLSEGSYFYNSSPVPSSGSYASSNPHNFTLSGYMNQSLSYFNLSYLQYPLRLPNGTFTGSYSAANHESIKICRYRDYRNRVPPFSLHYKYWVILVARLAFVIIFEHFVFFVTEALAYLIPDMPYVLKVHLARQRLLLRGALYEYNIQDEQPTTSNGAATVDLTIKQQPKEGIITSPSPDTPTTKDNKRTNLSPLSGKPEAASLPNLRDVVNDS